MIGANTGILCDPVSARSWDQSEIQRQVALRVNSYQGLGLARGDRVLFLIGNSLEFFVELIAIWRLGCCVIPCDPTLTQFEIDKIVQRLSPRFVVVSDSTNMSLISSSPGLSIVHTGEHHSDSQEFHPGDLRAHFEDDALILFTSGSTGQPKAVVHSLRALHSRLSAFEQFLGTADFQRSLCVLSTGHMQGLVMNSLYPWLSGCDLFVTPPFDPGVLMKMGELIDQYNITFLSSTPAMWKLVLKVSNAPKKGSLQRVHLASAPIGQELWKQIQQWAGINNVVNTYGTTEIGSSIAGTPSGNIIPESGLIGVPWGSQIKIMKSVDTSNEFAIENECTSGEPGVIYVKSPGLMKGYIEHQDLNELDLHQGWFNTGDTGTIDERKWLFILGRERDDINKGGLKITPNEVDEVVLQFYSAEDVCTFRYEDEVYGENVGIAVVLQDKRAETLRELHQWVDSRLATYKHPSKWYLLDQLPRNSNGKINRETVARCCDSKTPLNFSIAL